MIQGDGGREGGRVDDNDDNDNDDRTKADRLGDDSSIGVGASVRRRKRTRTREQLGDCDFDDAKQNDED